MKKRKISTYIIALLTVSSLFGFPTMTFAQKNDKDKVEELAQQPFFQGAMLGVDVFGISFCLFFRVIRASVALIIFCTHQKFRRAELGKVMGQTLPVKANFKTAFPYQFSVICNCLKMLFDFHYSHPFPHCILEIKGSAANDRRPLSRSFLILSVWRSL